jgi:hypothetical protein
MIRSVLLVSLLAASVTACSSNGGTSGGGGGSGGTGTLRTSTLKGHIVDGSGSNAAGFGGPGATQSSKTVSARTIDASGSTTSVADTTVAADGTYSLDVPLHDGATLVEALDAKGNVVVSAILEDALVAGDSLSVQPMTTESSVEASVMLEMVSSGTLLVDIDLVGLRARIDAATATVVQAHAADQITEATADIKALAMAALTAQISQQASLKAAKVDWTSYAAAELSAADTLTAALNANAGGTAQASAEFTAKLATLDAKFGLDAAAAASDATRASASARVAIDATSSSNDLIGAFDRTQAMVESAATAAAITEAFTKASASASIMEKLQTADTELSTQVAASASAPALSSAFVTWRSGVQGTASGTGGLLETVFGNTVTASVAYSTTITSLTAVAAALQASLASSAVASQGTSATIDPTTLAGLVDQAYATFDASVAATVKGSAIAFTGQEASLMTSVFVTSKGSF